MAVVFLSYSIGADAHATDQRPWVRALAERLRAENLDVRFDGFDLRAGESLTQYMERSIAEADFVLLVCTPRFALKTNERHGGVGYEQQIITGSVLDGRLQGRVIPLLRVGGMESIPTFLKGTLHVDFRNDTAFEESVEQLLRAVRGERPAAGIVMRSTSAPSSRSSLTQTIVAAGAVIAAITALWLIVGRSVPIRLRPTEVAPVIVIAGSVVDADTFASLEGARVSVGDKHMQTDSAGTFRIALRDPGEALVVVDRPGYERQSVRLIAPVGSLQIAMKKEKR